MTATLPIAAWRSNTDISAYCGKPRGWHSGQWRHVDPSTAPVAGAHPVDPVRCQPVVNTTTGVITGWGDNGDSGDAIYMYRHASGDIRVSSDGTTAAGAGTSVSRACAACHVSHGSSAAMTSFASDATLTADLTTPELDNSTLLRMDNRSLCLRCHAGTVNFTVAP